MNHLAEPPPEVWQSGGHDSLVSYLRSLAVSVITREGLNVPDLDGIQPVCATYDTADGPIRGFLVTTKPGRRFILDCDDPRNWREWRSKQNAPPPPPPAPPATDADVLAALANTHLFLDPSIAAPQVRPGPCPPERVKRTLPGSDIAVCTPEATFLYRAPSAGVEAPVLAWGKPPAGFKPSAAWGNSTLYEAPAGIPLGSLPPSKATFTVEAITRAPGSPLVLTQQGVRVNLAAFRPLAPAAEGEPPPEDKPAAAPSSNTGLIVGGLLAAAVGLAVWKPWKR